MMKIISEAFHRLEDRWCRQRRNYLKAKSRIIIQSNQLELTYDEGSVAPGVRSVEVHVLSSNKHAGIVTRYT